MANIISELLEPYYINVDNNSYNVMLRNKGVTAKGEPKADIPIAYCTSLERALVHLTRDLIKNRYRKTTVELKEYVDALIESQNNILNLLKQK